MKQLFSSEIESELSELSEEMQLLRLEHIQQANFQQRQRRFRLLRMGIFWLLGGGLVTGGIVGAVKGTHYVRTTLAPKISQALSEAIDRPLELGEIEQVSLTGIRLGPSRLPATATDADAISLKAIDVRFNLLQAWRNQQILLTVTLVEPTAFLDQDKAGDWLNLNLEFDEDAKVEIDRIRIQNATITLAPQPVTLDSEPLDPGEVWDTSNLPTQMTLRRVNGQFSLKEEGRQLLVQMQAQPHTGGRVWLKGDLWLGENSSESQSETQAGSKPGSKPESKSTAKPSQLAIRTQGLQLKSLMPFVPTDIQVDGGVLNSNVTLRLRPDQPLIWTGTAELRDGAMRTKGEPNPFTGIHGRFRFEDEVAILQQGGLSFGQIPFQIQGNIHLRQGFDLDAQVESLDAKPFMQTLQLEVPFPVSGVLSSENVRLTGALDEPILSGAVRAVQPVKVDRVEMAEVRGNFSLNLATDHLLLHQITLRPVTGGSLTTQAEIWLEEDNGTVNVQVNQLSADRLAQLYQVQLGDHSLGQFNARAQLILVNEEPTIKAHWTLDQGSFPAQGDFSLVEEVLRVDNATVALGAGRLQAKGVLKEGQWQADLSSEQVDLAQWLPGVPGQLQTAELTLKGNLDQSGLESVQATGEAAVQIASGAVTADLQAQQGKWQAQVQGESIPLQAFSDALPDAVQGEINGKVDLQGSLQQLDLQSTQATGEAELSGGLGFLTQPIQAAFAWNGEKIQIKQAKTDKITLNGWITPALTTHSTSHSTTAPTSPIQDLDLNVQIQDYDLSSLPLVQSAPVAVKGLVNVQGKVTGTPNAPQINSEVKIDRLAVQDFQFEPLQGQLRSQPDRQLRLDLKGSQDLIALTLDSTYQPRDFQIKLDQAEMEGQWQNQRLVAKLGNFSLAQLDLAPAAALGLGAVHGLLSGNVEADLSDLTQPVVNAALEVLRPGIGAINAPTHPRHAADRFTGTMTYRDGTAALTEGMLQVGSSRYMLAAAVNPQTTAWQGQVAVEQGSFQDLLSTLSPAELTALLQSLRQGTAGQKADGIASRPGEKTIPMSRFARAVAAVATQAAGDSAIESTGAPTGAPAEPSLPLGLTLPRLEDLATLTGTFSGWLKLQGSSQAKPAVQFNLQGQNWQFANYGIRQMTIANGEFDGQTWTLPQVQAEGLALPLAGTLRQFDSRLGFSGQISQSQVAGQVRLDAINLPQLQTLLNLPIALQGQVHATADLSGPLTQPNVNGALHLQDVVLRDMAIQEAKVGFQYVDQQFHLDSWESLTEEQLTTRP